MVNKGAISSFLGGKGLLVLKLRFRKNSDENFNAVERVIPEQRRFFELLIEGIRSSKEHICIHIPVFLRCILIEGA